MTGGTGSERVLDVREATFVLLRGLGLTTVFGNPGSTEETFLANFPDDFRFVLALQEASVIAIADGFAQASRAPALVNVHTATGLGNAMGNLMAAFLNRTPLIVTAGQQDRRMLLVEPWLTDVEPEVVARPWVKWAYQPARAQDVPGAVMRAYATAIQPPAGPVFLSLPLDDWAAPALGPDPARLQRLADAIAGAKRPVLIFGAAVARASGWDQAVALAEKMDAPVWAAPSSERAPFPEDHPLYQGGLPFAIGPLARHLDGHEPVRYDVASDRYVPVSWDDAFELAGSTLRGLDNPHQAAFYTSGRLSNEATFLYQLWVREFGTNNLPDCSNMCHEASGVAMTAALGTGKGTVDLHDWEQADAIWLMGDNAATNAPRMLTWLAEADRRGAALVHINPLIEAASRRTIVPHEFADMATLHTTKVGTMNVQVRIGGDMALMRGVAKAVFEAAATDPAALDGEFLEQFTHGVEQYRALCEATPWSELVRGSGVDEVTIRELADSYLKSGRVIIAWCLGVTQHEHGVDAVREIVNVLLLRGNIGREGAGPCPVRGHSNVQGNRTFGINHRPDKQFLDRLAEVCHIDPPREHGLDVVETLKAMHDGRVKVLVSLGGNLALAAPDTPYTFQAFGNCDLTVQVSTKLNRSHIVHGRQALILPCLGRTDKDRQAGGEQGVSVEDAMSMVHISYGMKDPVSPHLRSECSILAGLARATLPGSSTPWLWYAEDYDRIRDTVAQVLDGFEDFNVRVRQSHGFRISQPARERGFLTPSGRAEFGLGPLPGDLDPGGGRLMLATIRSHDQFNTTIYSNDDRYRGLKGLRTVVFMNSGDMRDRGLDEFDLVDITSVSRDGSSRSVYGYRAVRYEIPRGCAAGYMPELNVLCGIADYSTQSGQPVTKHLVVEVTPARSAGAGQ